MFNKFPFHRILVLFTLFSMSLTACNAAPTLTAPESTPVPTATNTPRPTETPTEVVRKFSVDALTLSPELTAALKKHAGLETSITLEANGRYTAAVSVLNTEGAPEVQTIEVAPAAMTEDLTTKNKYGDTPVMTTVDGKKLYWIQEEKAWFAVEISPDIHAPVLIPYGKIEIPLRVTIVEFPEAFSQEAVEFWKKTPGLFWEFTYLVRNALTGESTKFGYLRNRALGEAGLTVANSPVQYLDSWFAMDFPDGTRYEFSPTKWLDPDDPRNPKGDEWKIIFAASGPEIMGDENNRNTYDNLYTQAAGMRSRQEIVPVFIAQDGFFDSASPLITLSTGQPSLEKLLHMPANTIMSMMLPDGSGANYKTFFNMHFPNLSAQNAGFGVGWDKSDPGYSQEFLPDDVQTILVPSMIILH